MKITRLLIAVLFLVAAMWAADVRIAGSAAYTNAPRGLTWAGTTGSINNAFVLDVPGPNSGVCVSVSNNDASTHTFTILAEITNDNNVTVFTGSTSNWSVTPVSPTTVGSVLGNATNLYWVNAAGAAHVAISISAGSGTGTVDLTFSAAASSCVGSGVNQNGSVCNKSGTVRFSAVGNAVVSVVPPAGQFVHVCSVSVSCNGSTAILTLANGTAGTCTTPGATLWEAITNSNVAPSSGSGIGQTFQTSVAAQPVCAVASGTFTTIDVNVSSVIY